MKEIADLTVENATKMRSPIFFHTYQRSDSQLGL